MLIPGYAYLRVNSVNQKLLVAKDQVNLLNLCRQYYAQSDNLSNITGDNQLPLNGKPSGFELSQIYSWSGICFNRFFATLSAVFLGITSNKFDNQVRLAVWVQLVSETAAACETFHQCALKFADSGNMLLKYDWALDHCIALLVSSYTGVENLFVSK